MFLVLAYDRGMNEVRQSLLIGVCLTSLGAAQSPSFLLDPQYRMIAEETEQAERAKAERSQREFSERELHDRMNRVAEVWRGLVDEFNNKRADSQALAASTTTFPFTWYSCISCVFTYDTPVAKPSLFVTTSRAIALVITSQLPVFIAGITRTDEAEKSA